jgi:hypothetical protein
MPLGEGVGVYGTSENNIGVWGQSEQSYGASFQGGLAPLRLVPSNTAGPPTTGTHNMGELYVDSQGVLYFCTAASSTAAPAGTWKTVQLGATT